MKKPLPTIKPAETDPDARLGTPVIALAGAVDPATFLEAVARLSPYLGGLIKRHPETVELATDGFDLTLKTLFADLENSVPFMDEAALSTALRTGKQQVHLLAALADLGGWWSCDMVQDWLSRYADLALTLTMRHLVDDATARGKLLPQITDDPLHEAGITILAMGKHGAAELNYSSDIDLIVLVDPDAARVPDRDEALTLFVRMTKAMTRIMQDRTAGGYVFRTDLRLRPDPGSMPLAVPIGTALVYYEARGQNWERAALIKARPVAGDIALGTRFLHELTPFIWRKYLDYAAIADIHSIKRQLQSHRDLLEKTVAGHNVKLGRGGIREIEFFVQTQQLIAGGRAPALRVKKTLNALDALAFARWVDDDIAAGLKASYRFLRDVEHRIQMVADEQTHTLPEDKKARSGIATLSGFASLANFEAAFRAHCDYVENAYSVLFEPEDTLAIAGGSLVFAGSEDDPATLQTLAKLGYANPQRVISTVKNWHFGRYPAVQTSEARQRLTEFTPRLLEAIAASGRADGVLSDFDRFLTNLPSGFQLFHLLHSNPDLLNLLVRILAAAPRLAELIVRRPHVFDGMLEPQFFRRLATSEEMRDQLSVTLQQARDYEDALDRARIFAAEQRFLIGARVLAKALKPVDAAPHYTRLADVVVQAMLELVLREMEQAHGTIAGGACCIVAMGNLGSGELTASSDLDLLLLYRTDPGDPESDGPRPLYASQYYGRVTQRFIAAMTAPTAQGILYELDFRLRPSGKAGPIATSLAAFEKYQREEAWTWERMALTRARASAGSADFVTQVQAVIDDVLVRGDDRAKVAADVLDMRLTMDDARAPTGLWDVKLAKGGLVDIEFLAQYLVLTGQGAGHATADIVASAAAALHDDNVTVSEALATFRSTAQLIRLCLEDGFDGENTPQGFIDLLLDELSLPDLPTAAAHLQNLQKQVRAVFLAHLSGSA